MAKSSALPKILPQPVDIHTKPEAKDSAVSHFQVLMFDHIIKNTHKRQSEIHQKLIFPQRKIVQKHRSKTPKVISHSSDKDQSSYSERPKGKTKGIQTRLIVWIQLKYIKWVKYNRHRPSLTQGINATHIIKHSFYSHKESTIKMYWQIYTRKNLHTDRQVTEITTQTKFQNLPRLCALVSRL